MSPRLLNAMTLVSNVLPASPPVFFFLFALFGTLKKKKTLFIKNNASAIFLQVVLPNWDEDDPT